MIRINLSRIEVSHTCCNYVLYHYFYFRILTALDCMAFPKQQYFCTRWLGCLKSSCYILHQTLFVCSLRVHLYWKDLVCRLDVIRLQFTNLDASNYKELCLQILTDSLNWFRNRFESHIRSFPYLSQRILIKCIWNWTSLQDCNCVYCTFLCADNFHVFVAKEGSKVLFTQKVEKSRIVWLWMRVCRPRIIVIRSWTK